MAASALPALLAGLVDRFTAALDGHDVQVLDGDEVVDQTSERVLWVGWQPDSEDVATGRQSFNAAGARTRDEELQAYCYLEIATGDLRVPVARTRLYELLGLLEIALRATVSAPDAPTLGGAVQWAELTEHTLIQAQGDRGLVLGVKFTVSARARI